jgi:hypothetical protein
LEELKICVFFGPIPVVFKLFFVKALRNNGIVRFGMIDWLVRFRHFGELFLTPGFVELEFFLFWAIKFLFLLIFF